MQEITKDRAKALIQKKGYQHTGYVLRNSMTGEVVILDADKIFRMSEDEYFIATRPSRSSNVR